MRKLLIIPLILLLASCASMGGLGGIESDTGLGTSPFEEGGQYRYTDANAMNDSIIDNHERIEDIEEIVGLVKCDGTDCEAAVAGTDYVETEDTANFKTDETDQIDDLTEETPSDADLLLWEDVTTGNLRSVPIADVPGLGTASITASADPDVDSESTITHDTDDEWLRCYDDDTGVQWVCGLKNPSIQGTIATPNSYSDALRDFFPIWRNTTSAIFTIWAIYVQSDTDNTALEFVSYPGPTNWTGTTIESMNVTDNGTNCYYTSDVAISGDATIAAGEGVAIDFDDTDTPGVVTFQILGWFNADVN